MDITQTTTAQSMEHFPGNQNAAKHKEEKEDYNYNVRLRSKSETLLERIFGAGGLYVSTVGLDEDSVKKYIRGQEAQDTRFEQLNFVHAETPSSGGD